MASCNMLQVDIMQKLTFLQIHTYAVLLSEPLHAWFIGTRGRTSQGHGPGHWYGDYIDSLFEIGNALH